MQSMPEIYPAANIGEDGNQGVALLQVTAWFLQNSVLCILWVGLANVGQLYSLL